MEAAIHRRLIEELGVRCPMQFLFKFRYQAQFDATRAEHELCSVYMGRCSAPLRINRREILAVRWISPAALESEMVGGQAERFTRGSSSSGSASGENTALHFSLCNRSYHFEHSADSGLPRCSLHCWPQIAGRQALSAGVDARADALEQYWKERDCSEFDPEVSTDTILQ
jgi:NUDIX domain